MRAFAACGAAGTVGAGAVAAWYVPEERSAFQHARATAGALRADIAAE